MTGVNDLYANRIFFNAALPLLKVLADEIPSLKKGFAGKSGIIQISAVTDDGGLAGTHFVITDGEWEVVTGTSEEKPNLELRFSDIPKMNDFFKGKMTALPKISGFFSGFFVPALKLLLKLSGMLGASAPPKDEFTKELLVKMYFYLLANGVSQLNKAGQPDVKKWADASPDRVYAFRVVGKDELAAYIRVKAGNTKASRGLYTRALPFFCLAFRDVDSALGTLLQIDDLFEASCEGKIIMEGAPEFGSILGDFMLLVAALAK